MQLNLRTLLKWVDDRGITPSQRGKIDRALENDSRYKAWLTRIRKVRQDTSLAPIPVDADNWKEANLVAQFLDGTLSREEAEEMETRAWNRDSMLADLVRCHTLVAQLEKRESGIVSLRLRQSVYALAGLTSQVEQSSAPNPLDLGFVDRQWDDESEGEAAPIASTDNRPVERAVADNATPAEAAETIDAQNRPGLPASRRIPMATWVVGGLMIAIIAFVCGMIFTNLDRQADSGSQEKPTQSGDIPDSVADASEKTERPSTTPAQSKSARDGELGPGNSNRESGVGEPGSERPPDPTRTFGPEWQGPPEPPTELSGALPAAPRIVFADKDFGKGAFPDPPGEVIGLLVTPEQLVARWGVMPVHPAPADVLVEEPEENAADGAEPPPGNSIEHAPQLAVQIDATPGWYRLPGSGPVRSGSKYLVLDGYSPIIQAPRRLDLTIHGPSQFEVVRGAANAVASFQVDYGLFEFNAPIAQSRYDFSFEGMATPIRLTLATLESRALVQVFRYRRPGEAFQSARQTVVQVVCLEGQCAWLAGDQFIELQSAQALSMVDFGKADVGEMSQAPADWLQSTRSRDWRLLANEMAREVSLASPLLEQCKELFDHPQIEVRNHALRSMFQLGHFNNFRDVFLDHDMDRNRDYWRKHIAAVQFQLDQDAERENEFVDALQSTGEFGDALARLFQGFSDEQLKAGGDQQLVDWLSHPALVVRTMAIHVLQQITGETRRYRPNRSQRDQASSIRNWKLLLRKAKIRYVESPRVPRLMLVPLANPPKDTAQDPGDLSPDHDSTKGDNLDREDGVTFSREGADVTGG